MTIREVLRKAFFYDKWDVGIYLGNIDSFIKNQDQNKIIWLQNYNKYSFIADPFIWEENNKISILAEHFNYFTCKGKIILIENIEANSCSKKLQITDAIVTDWHMSYPYIFEYEGEKYCVPETSQANKLMLYKYERSAGKFIYQKDLIENFAAIDSTILFFEGKWWLFCTKAPKGNSDLFVWYSDNPLSVWHEHGANPVKSDNSSARPAGNFFNIEGKLYRTSQNCKNTYGGSVFINEIITLNEKEFAERPLIEIKPQAKSPFSDGLHTISVGKNIVVIDGKKLQFSLLNPAFIIIQKIRAHLARLKRL